MGIKYDMAIGLNKGHKVTPVEAGRKTRPSRRKGVGVVLYSDIDQAKPQERGRCSII